MKVKSNVYVLVGGYAVLLRPGDTVPDGVEVTNPAVIDADSVREDEEAAEAAEAAAKEAAEKAAAEEAAAELEAAKVPAKKVPAKATPAAE